MKRALALPFVAFLLWAATFAHRQLNALGWWFLLRYGNTEDLVKQVNVLLEPAGLALIRSELDAVIRGAPPADGTQRTPKDWLQ
jgi:hypothetical protein